MNNQGRDACRCKRGYDGVDEVHCGSGHDTVIYNLETNDDDIAADCEEVLLLS